MGGVILKMLVGGIVKALLALAGEDNVAAVVLDILEWAAKRTDATWDDAAIARAKAALALKASPR